MLRVFVPLDGSVRAERAVPVAATIGRALGGRLELVHVLEDQLAYGIFQITTEVAAQDAEAYLRRMAALYGDGDAVGYCLPHGRVAEAIVRLTKETQDTMVVMATHGHGELGRVPTGGVADGIVRGAAGPVLLIRDELASESWELRRLIVALDGSKRAEEALPVAARLAKAAGSRLELLRVVPMSRPPAIRSRHYSVRTQVAGVERRILRRARRYLDHQVDQLAQVGLVAATDIEVGKPVQQILQSAQRDRADLIVMTRHGRGGLRRWVLGSVSRAVLHQAQAPVLIVSRHEPARTSEEQHEPERAKFA